ncbi:MAG: AAA family ATPase [candidate division KSB1 bacterium]|nr:AAA family ATPase [candidate division KSB1 bacterium]
MITKLFIKNFKCFRNVEIELGDRVVFIGPNNSGKTSALQALSLWEIGIRRWIEKRGTGRIPQKRPGVTINRRDILAIPVPSANLLWRNLKVRFAEKAGEKHVTKNIRIEIGVEGISDGKIWQCNLKFDYANEESLYCRPVRSNGQNSNSNNAIEIPEQVKDIRIAFLPPMSGLTSAETRLDPGAINVRLGEGRTAEILRNLCYLIYESENGKAKWTKLKNIIKELFGVELHDPEYIIERGELSLSYTENNIKLDLTSAGRGLHQTLLLLAYMMLHPKSIILLDEPDAHLEFLRQRQIYQILSETAEEYKSQIIAASHSEVLLNEAADRDIVIAFVGKPHRIDDRGSQLLKALKDIGFDQFIQAEQTGWVLYLEGSTDLAILRAFAKKLNHAATSILERPFVYYIGNQPRKAQEHFYGLREAKPDLVGIAIFDRLDRQLPSDPNLVQYMWSKKEIENYLCTKDVLLRWAESKIEQKSGPLFSKQSVDLLNSIINEIENALQTLGKPSPWSGDLKVTDEFLDRLFEIFFRKQSLPNLMPKTNYHILADYILPHEIDDEVKSVLDMIYNISQQANPMEENAD